MDNVHYSVVHSFCPNERQQFSVDNVAFPEQLLRHRDMLFAGDDFVLVFDTRFIKLFMEGCCSGYDARIGLAARKHDHRGQARPHLEQGRHVPPAFGVGAK
jgi:hypothetical protein